MPIRRPQISLRGPWARGGRTSAPGPAKGGTDPAAELWSSGMSGEPGSGTDETPPAQQRRRSTDVTGLKPRRVIKSRLLPSPQEDEAADEVRSAAIRVVLVEDVAEVAAHIRGLFRPRSNVNLLDVLSDTRNALDRIRDLDADVVIVDTLLQGRVKGSTLIDRIRKSGLPVGIVAVTVPDRPLDRRRAATVDAVLTMPFGMFDLVHAINDAHVASANRNPTASS
ncbi:MAG: response regulator, partial [Chloroflexota bacterium]